MKFKAVLKTESMDPISVSKALEIDNIELENMRIKTIPYKGYILTTVESNSLKSVLNTLDDIIFCQMVAEEVIK